MRIQNVSPIKGGWGSHPIYRDKLKTTRAAQNSAIHQSLRWHALRCIDNANTTPGTLRIISMGASRVVFVVPQASHICHKNFGNSDCMVF